MKEFKVKIWNPGKLSLGKVLENSLKFVPEKAYKACLNLNPPLFPLSLKLNLG